MKKHFIQIGQAGLIYYSWLFVILFIGLIFHYEKTTPVSGPAWILIILFLLLILYSYFCSYWQKDYFKLPYRPAIKKSFVIKQRWRYRRIVVATVEINRLQQYNILFWQKKS